MSRAMFRDYGYAGTDPFDKGRPRTYTFHLTPGGAPVADVLLVSDGTATGGSVQGIGRAPDVYGPDEVNALYIKTKNEEYRQLVRQGPSVGDLVDETPRISEVKALIAATPRELFFGEDNTDVTTAQNVNTDIPGTVGTFVIQEGEARPVYADYGINVRSSIVNGVAVGSLWIDNVLIGSSFVGGTSATANAAMTASRRKRLAGLAPGEHTCKLVITSFSAATATARGAGGAPSFLSLTFA